MVLCLVEFTFDEKMNEEHRVCCGRHWKVCRKFVRSLMSWFEKQL